MTIIERIRNYVKHKFSVQKFEDYKTKDDQIVTGELEVGKELLDLESMTPLDGVIIIDDKKIEVEKGYIKTIETIESDESEEMVSENEEVSDETTEEVSDETTEENMEVDPKELLIKENESLKEKVKSLEETIDSLTKEVELMKCEKDDISKEFEAFKNQPVNEVFKDFEKPIKKNSKEVMASNLREIAKMLK